jgi:hypothetical protein
MKAVAKARHSNSTIILRAVFFRFSFITRLFPLYIASHIIYYSAIDYKLIGQLSASVYKNFSKFSQKKRETVLHAQPSYGMIVYISAILPIF